MKNEKGEMKNTNNMRHKKFVLAALLLTFGAGITMAQNGGPYANWGSSHPSQQLSCDSLYMWPRSGILNPCPEVEIRQAHDHPSQYSRTGSNPGVRPWSNDPNDKGWDTAITCQQPYIIISCMPFIPAKQFGGTYTVDEIPYSSNPNCTDPDSLPPDPTFYLNYNQTLDATNPNKIRLDINCDDIFAPQATQLGFPFYFFGQLKTQFRLGDNGMVTFTNDPLPNDAFRGNCACSSSQGNTRPYCPFSFGSTQLPFTNANTPERNQSKCDGTATTCDSRMHDAIFGCYFDTYPTPSTVTYPQGIYYGVLGEYPCRKIIASWNQIPECCSGTNPRSTFQMVCYEGSNIIEIWIKEHNPNSHNAIMGIMDDDGLPNTQTTPTPSAYVWPNSPAAFWPTGKNNFSSSQGISYKAYRFTPRPRTLTEQKNYKWYRKLDAPFNDTIDGVIVTKDTIHLRSYQETLDNPSPRDTNGYYIPMGDVPAPSYVTNPYSPTLTTAVVKPTIPSRYYFYLYFKDANNNEYPMLDSIIIGVDTTAELSLHAKDSVSTNKNLKLCANTIGNLQLEYPKRYKADTITYGIWRHSNGDTIQLSVDDCLFLDNWDDSDNDNYKQPIRLRATLPNTGVVPNKIDSLLFYVNFEFSNKCPKKDSMWLCIYPNFDITIDTGICRNSQFEGFLWDANGQRYYNSVQVTDTLKSEPKCDSIVHLNLTVYDRSYTVDHVVRCKEFTWINDSTYYESNNTAKVDTTNRWGCDSTVQLDFKLMPVTARIQSDRDFFDFDHLDAVLTDISLNNHSRKWLLNDNLIGTGTTLYYSIQPEADEARIYLVATSDSGGCVDTTNILIPMRKESFWMPNIFTPGRDNGNNLFGSISSHTLTQEMFVYNRNGQLVFRCDTPDCKWDGRDLNGNNCPQGTYTYLVRYTNEYLPKVTHVLRGTVTLIR